MSDTELDDNIAALTRMYDAAQEALEHWYVYRRRWLPGYPPPPAEQTDRDIRKLDQLMHELHDAANAFAEAIAPYREPPS